MNTKISQIPRPERVSIQGIEASFHDAAAHRLYDDEAIELVCRERFSQVFEDVRLGVADSGVVAIENNINGPINEVYRLLVGNPEVIVTGEYRMKIGQHAIGKTILDLAEIDEGRGFRVYSHPVALAQVSGWLDSYMPEAERIEHKDTAASVRKVVEEYDEKAIAIAGSRAAEVYGGVIIAANIQDDPGNYTRFISFRNGEIENPRATNGSMILTAEDSEGSLLRVLRRFKLQGCNLNSLHSQPIPGDKQHYYFYLDYTLRGSNDRLIRRLQENLPYQRLIRRILRTSPNRYEVRQLGLHDRRLADNGE